MDCGERSSTRTSPCLVARHRSRRRRRGSTSPFVTSACAGPRSACDLISLEEMNRFPRASTLFGARAGILMNEIDTTNSSRAIIRYLPSSSFLDCVSLLADAFVRAAAGLLARGGRRAVEPGNRAPLRVVLHVGSATPRDVRAGAVPVWMVFGRALRSCAALFMMVKFGATSLVAAAALRLLVESYAATAKVGRMEGLPLSPLVEMRGLTRYRRARRVFLWTSLASERRSHAACVQDGRLECIGLAYSTCPWSTMEAGSFSHIGG